jgi:hypothetical protein
MLFSFNGTNLNDLKHKSEMIEISNNFWRSLGIQYKLSVDLIHFLISKCCDSFVVNRNININNDNNIKRYYILIFKFLNDLYLINKNNNNIKNNGLTNESFINFIFIKMIQFVVNTNKNKKKFNQQHINFDLIINDILNEKTSSLLFIQNQRHQIDKQNLTDSSLYFLLQLCSDYDSLKKCPSSSSYIETLMLFLALIKKIGILITKNDININYNKKVLTQIQMSILDDVYSLYSTEKNHLRSSFVRKAQGDLLEWNTTTTQTTPTTQNNDSDLKEILYLKSLQKFATFSLQQRYSRQNNSFIKTDHFHDRNNVDPSLNSTIQFEVCKKLCAYYDKLDHNYSKVLTSRILSAESKFNKLAFDLLPSDFIQGQEFNNTNENVQGDQLNHRQNPSQHGHLYFRCGFFGQKLRNIGIRNRYFIYKHTHHEMLSNIRKLMLDKLTFTLSKVGIEEEEENGDEEDQESDHNKSDFDSSSWSTSPPSSLSSPTFIGNTTKERVELIFNLSNDDTTDQKQQEFKKDKKYLINNVKLLHHNNEPSDEIKNDMNQCYIQVCALNTVGSTELVELIKESKDNQIANNTENLIENDLLSLNEKNKSEFHYFDRPFYLNNKRNDNNYNDCDDSTHHHQKEEENVENLWLERSILITENVDSENFNFKSLSDFDQIIGVYKILLNPLRNAINDINEKTKELKYFVVEFSMKRYNSTSNSNLNNNNVDYLMNIIHSLQPLTMRLLGCLDARVNGGLIRYVKELLNDTDSQSQSSTPEPDNSSSSNESISIFFLIYFIK